MCDESIVIVRLFTIRNGTCAWYIYIYVFDKIKFNAQDYVVNIIDIIY